MSDDAMAAVSCTNLKKIYRLGFWARRVLALSGVSFEVEEGQVFGLIGPNGAGKSTTIKILLNLVFATEGTATLFGVDVREQKARRSLGFVPESPVPYEYLTGLEYLTFQGRLNGSRGADLTADLKRVIDRVDMGSQVNLQIRRYSKGMVQRIMLAGALLGRPRLVILDEPTSGLDPLGRRLVRDIILEERKRGAAILFCTHIMSDVETLCDRVALLVGGTIQRQGTTSELVSQGSRSHEVVVEEVDEAFIKSVQGAERAEAIGRGALFVVKDERLQQFLGEMIAKNARISRVEPVKISLEETFIAAVRDSNVRVGSSIE